jgi:hypothetical protein
VPATKALILLLSTLDSGVLDAGQSHLNQGTVQSPVPPSDKSTPIGVRDLSSKTWRLYIEDPYVRDAARRTIEEAAHWLAFEECQQLLLDFANESGRRLGGRLAELGVTVVEYLRLIIFEDGTNRSRCRQNGILAFTSPGSRVIYLCGRDFMRAAQRAPDDVRAIVIHELLHSLGLGENPPSSGEITRRVRERCWR